MNSQSEKNLSLDELKMRNNKDLMVARDTERQVVVTEKNWEAVIRLLQSILSEQEKVPETLSVLLNREDVEKHLVALMQQNQKHREQLQAIAEQFELQVGNASEKFSSGSEMLVESTKKSLDSMVGTTRSQLTDMMNQTRQEISDMVENARQRVIANGFWSWVLLTLLAVLYALRAIWS